MEGPIIASYIGCGCNNSPHVLDWGENNLLCFGVSNAIAVCDPKENRIVSTLSEHLDTVVSVKWIKGCCVDKNELVSASADSKIIIWALKCRDSILFDVVFTLHGHDGPVCAVDGIYHNSETIIASAGIDGSVRVWLRKDQNGFESLKVIDLGRSVAFCLDLFAIDGAKSCLLAFGTDSPELLFYSVGSTSDSVHQLAKVHGHEDWIRTVSMKGLKNGDIFVASAGQDMTVRILRLSHKVADKSTDFFHLKEEELLIEELKYYMSLETVLLGHEGWIYSVDWSPINDDDTCSLLTASFDRTVVVWKPCSLTGVWIEESKMGELGGDNTLGYYGSKFAPSGTSIIAHSYQGSFHMWKKDQDKWVADYAFGGHNDAVMDICWEENGHCLLSVSSDKTTRLHAPHFNKNSSAENLWRELSRPQIHGHALTSVAFLKNMMFASCSEEKVVRVFGMSEIVMKLLNSYYALDSLKPGQINISFPKSATVAALSLSNKALHRSDINSSVGNNFFSNEVAENHLIINEDFLVQHTLWPETMKLYGHGNDVYTISASNDGKILATAAKASNADQAKILLWDTGTWKIIDSLVGHQLTVTQMEFSPNDLFLLSVSRDRKWCLFKKNENGKFVLHSIPEKNIHSRIIWSCSWSHDGIYFVTGSRDCKVVIWESGKPVSSMVSDKGSVTAVAFSPLNVKNYYLIALGLECGNICLHLWCLDGWKPLVSIHKHFGHHLTVQRLRFCPIKKTENERNIIQLASCSLDHSVRIFDLYLNKLNF